jgi:arginase
VTKKVAPLNDTIGIIGVPTSAGAHGPGLEKAPRFMRDAGLVGKLVARGAKVVDHGDLSEVRFRPDPNNRTAQNLPAVVEVASQVSDAVSSTVGAGEMPLVLGGDCTITVGAVSGLLRCSQDVGLLYFDGGLDLATPQTYRPGILDSMGLAHIVAEPGCAPQLAGIGPRYPLMPGRMIVPFAYSPGEPAHVEREILDRHGIIGLTVAEIRGRLDTATTQARHQLERRTSQFLIHFDVDAIDFVDFPVADVPNINAGLSYTDAMASLKAITASPNFAGLIVTEFNPDHDPDTRWATRFVDDLANILAPPPT